MRLFSTLFIGLAFLLPHSTFATDDPALKFATLGKAQAECFYSEKGEFVLRGDFDIAAKTCFKKTYKQGTKIIRVNSNGGQNAIGIILANGLKGEHFHLIIEDRCNSACAQYIMPMADEITLERGAGVVIHGAMSEIYLHASYKPQFIAQIIAEGHSIDAAEYEYQEFLQYGRKQIEVAEELRSENNVGRGWLMQARTWSDNAAGYAITETDLDWLRNKDVAGILIDRTFIESCLPDVKINQFFGPSSAVAKDFIGYQDRIEAANLAVLPHAKCVN